jgi:3-hydroxyisobutyrate dehydrogenase
MKVGYVGLGSMGSALVGRLLRGHEVFVYDLGAAAVERMVEQGATGCATAAEVAASSEVVLLCLPTSDHVRAAVFGADGVAQGAAPGTLLVDQTTGDPVATREMAAELDARGLALVDAPVSGGPFGARAGTIAVMVGATADQYDALTPVLQAISPNVFHAGDVGAGHVMKLVNNLLAAANRAVTLEGLALAAKNGLDLDRAVDILLASSGRNFYLETFVKSHILSGQLASGFTLELQHKDVRLACQLGTQTGVPLPLGNGIKEFFQLCMNLEGPTAQVNTSAVVMDRLAGTHMVPEDRTA